MLPFVFLLIEEEDDRRFLEDAYTRYHRLMYAQALQILHDSQRAEDAVSDALLSLIKKISLLRSLDCNKLRSYIVITVKHTAINHFNRGKRESLTLDADIEDLAGGRAVDERLLSQAGIEQVKNAICSLPPREKDVMLMKYFRELSDEEIAREMGVRPVSVRVHLSRARKHLEAALGREA